MQWIGRAARSGGPWSRKFSPAPGKTKEPLLRKLEPRGGFPQAQEVFPSARENQEPLLKTIKEPRGSFPQAQEVFPSARENQGASPENEEARGSFLRAQRVLPAPGKIQEPRLKTEEPRGSFPRAQEVFPSAGENQGALLKARRSAEVFPGARKLFPRARENFWTGRGGSAASRIFSARPRSSLHPRGLSKDAGKDLRSAGKCSSRRTLLLRRIPDKITRMLSQPEAGARPPWWRLLFAAAFSRGARGRSSAPSTPSPSSRSGGVWLAVSRSPGRLPCADVGCLRSRVGPRCSGGLSSHPCLRILDLVVPASHDLVWCDFPAERVPRAGGLA